MLHFFGDLPYCRFHPEITAAAYSTDIITQADYMIAPETLSRLEFHKLLTEIARHAHSASSIELIQAISPGSDLAALRERSGRIDQIRALQRLGISLSLSAFEDIRPSLDLLKPAGAFLTPQQLLLFIPVLDVFAALARQFSHRDDIPLLKTLQPQLKGFPEILEPLTASIDYDGSILDSASTFLRETRRAKRTLAGRIRKKIEEIIRDSGIEIFLQDDFITQRSGRWVIPVRMDSKGMVKGVVHDVSSSGETAFMEPLEIIPFVNELENLAAEEKAEEIRILRQLSSWIREDSSELAGCLSGPIPTGPIRTVAMPVPRRPGFGHQPTRESLTTANPGPSPETSYLVYAARAIFSSFEPTIHPSDSRPTNASLSLTGPPSRR